MRLPLGCRERATNRTTSTSASTSARPPTKLKSRSLLSSDDFVENFTLAGGRLLATTITLSAAALVTAGLVTVAGATGGRFVSNFASNAGKFATLVSTFLPTMMSGALSSGEVLRSTSSAATGTTGLISSGNKGNGGKFNSPGGKFTEQPK